VVAKRKIPSKYGRETGHTVLGVPDSGYPSEGTSSPIAREKRGADLKSAPA
jgi:hypothetical protein